MKQPQNYANHKKIVPIVHIFLLPLGLVTAIAAVVYAAMSIVSGEHTFASILLLALAISTMLTTLVSRLSALKVQDRIIRTEEDLRHYKLTGQWLDTRLTIKQIIALRFASDSEFALLCEKAVKENMAPDTIKRAINDWKGDYYRV